MHAKCNCPFLVFCFVLLAFMGCKRKDEGNRGDAPEAAVSTEEITRILDTVTRGMSEISLDKLSTTRNGQECVIAARKPEAGLDLGRTPPPRGMVRIVAQTVIYKAQLAEVSPGIVTLQSPYPTSGNYKTLEIATEDIQSVHMKL